MHAAAARALQCPAGRAINATQPHTRRAVTVRRASSAAEKLAEDYRRDGFVVVPQLLSPEEVDASLAEMVRICRGECGEIEGLVPVDGSGPAASDDEVLLRYLAIHFPHKVSPQVLGIAKQRATVDVLRALIGPDVKMMQTMAFMKAAGKPGQAPHQDEYYIPTRDRSLCGVWIALDDATVENGCLEVIPGSHAAGVIYPTEGQTDPRYDVSPQSVQYPYGEDDYVPVPVAAGGAIFFNGYLLHRSQANRSSSFRRAFANHYMSASSMLPWTNDGRFPDISGEGDNRDVVLVAGTDPYARWSPTVDLTKPFVRADSAAVAPEQLKGLLR